MGVLLADVGEGDVRPVVDEAVDVRQEPQPPVRFQQVAAQIEVGDDARVRLTHLAWEVTDMADADAGQVQPVEQFIDRLTLADARVVVGGEPVEQRAVRGAFGDRPADVAQFVTLTGVVPLVRAEQP